MPELLSVQQAEELDVGQVHEMYRGGTSTAAR